MTVLLGLAVAGAALPAGASGSPRVDRGFELNISSNGDWHAGEPELAINPRNSKNLVMVWPEELATGQYRNPVTGRFDTLAAMTGSANDPHASRCGLAVSRDGGVTWRRSVLPITTPQSTLCSDAVVAAGPDGTFYAGAISYHQPKGQNDGLAVVVISSSDGGRTWTRPVDAIGNRGRDSERYEPGSNPESGCTCDRPWIAVEQTTGTVLVSGQADSVNNSSKTEVWVTASHDHGRHFGTVYPIDGPDLPEYGVGVITTAPGVLAAVYVGSPPSESTHALVFETSRDEGRSWRRHVVDSWIQTGVDAGNLVAGINVAADPDHAGRYTALVAGTTGVSVYRTSDDGKNWSGPVSVPVGTYHPWLAESPHGVVGVMGRHRYPDNSQDVLASFSSDGGAHFTSPITVNHQRAPARPPDVDTLISIYDDVSWITLTDRYAYVAWGDWRSTAKNRNGELNAWVARMSYTP
jgi:hypothetical protein